MSRFDVSDNADELNAAIDNSNFPRSNSIVSNGSWNGSAQENGLFRFARNGSRKNSQELTSQDERDERDEGDERDEVSMSPTGGASSTQNGFMRRPHPTPLKMRSISESNGHDLYSAAALKTPRTATTPGNFEWLTMVN